MNPPLLLGFTRGVAPSKWAARWSRAEPDLPLELVPFELAFGRPADAAEDVLLERAAPGERPAGSEPDDEARTHHAVRLYEEAVALVVPADHELADQEEILAAELGLIRLIDHPHHPAVWPAAQPWEDPGWMPRDLPAALALVATGIGGLLAPLPLARHLVAKRAHAVLRVVPGDAPLPGTTIWASWRLERDAADVQQLAGILRGRTARSSRPAASADRGDGRGTGGGARSGGTGGSGQSPARKKQPALKPNSRGAQLAAARDKAERAKALKRAEKKRKRR